MHKTADQSNKPDTEKKKKPRGKPFRKGQSGNPSGRPNNLPGGNKFTQNLKRWADKVVTVKELQALFAKLKPEYQASFINSVLPYLSPKEASTVKLEGQIQVEQITGMKFTHQRHIKRLLPINETNTTKIDKDNQQDYIEAEKAAEHASEPVTDSKSAEETEPVIMETKEVPAGALKLIQQRVIKTGITWQEQERLDLERSQRMDQYTRINNSLNDF